MPRALWWSQGGLPFSERGTPAEVMPLELICTLPSPRNDITTGVDSCTAGDSLELLPPEAAVSYSGEGELVPPLPSKDRHTSCSLQYFADKALQGAGVCFLLLSQVSLPHASWIRAWGETRPSCSPPRCLSHTRARGSWYHRSRVKRGRRMTGVTLHGHVG